MSNMILESIQTLQHRAERLEQEATLLRQELARVAEILVRPTSVVARYVIEGETYEITQADVDAGGNSKDCREKSVIVFGGVGCFLLLN